MKATSLGAIGAAADVQRAARERLHAATKRRTSPKARVAPVNRACGIDVVDLGRFRRLVALRGGLFFATVYTPGELADCADCLGRLAARFAAKEAVSKALGCGIGPVGWRELEIRVDRDGRPRLRLHGRAARRARSLGVSCWALTLKHSRSVAAAMVFGCGPAADANATALGTPERWRF